LSATHVLPVKKGKLGAAELEKQQIVRRIRKLRWLGIDNEARKLEATLSALAPATLPKPRPTVTSRVEADADDFGRCKEAALSFLLTGPSELPQLKLLFDLI
jgi:hypothetical protein